VKERAYVFIFARCQAALDEAVKLIGGNVTAIQANATRLEDLDRVAERRRRRQQCLSKTNVSI
jgi:hypothetical protein